MRRRDGSRLYYQVVSLRPAAAVFLSGPAAKVLARRAVKHHPTMGYTNGFEKKATCDRLSRSRQRCSMQWDVGPALLKGHATIGLRADGRAAYRLDFKALDRNCECTYDYPNWRGVLSR